MYILKTIKECSTGNSTVWYITYIPLKTKDYGKFISQYFLKQFILE